MKTDKIFYTIFQVFPELLFQLLGQPPTLAQNYQYLQRIYNDLDRPIQIYLDRLTPQTSSSLGLQIIQFIIAPEVQATEQVTSLLNQAKQQVRDATIQQNIVELIEKIVVYKFPQKSRQELEAMFSLTEWKQTRFYQEAKEEGKLEGEEKGKLEGEEKGKLKTVPLLLKLGLTTEQIAEELKINIDKIQQFIASQNN